MGKNSFLLILSGMYMLSFLMPQDGLGQSSPGTCSASVLAMSMTPVVKAEIPALGKSCKKKEEMRINQRPTPTFGNGMVHYDHVAFDQLEHAQVNIYPGPSKSCKKQDRNTKPGSQQGTKKLTACKAQSEKKCPPPKGESPKRLRPSATVKLVKYQE